MRQHTFVEAAGQIVNARATAATGGSHHAYHGPAPATDLTVIVGHRSPTLKVLAATQITGNAHFNEVFLTDAYVDAQNRLGEVNDGWKALMTALGLERSVMGGRAAAPRVRDGERYVGTADNLVALALARRHRRSDDPLIRDRIVDIYAQRAAVTLNQLRFAAASKAAYPAAMSMSKLAMSRLLHATAGLRTDIVGMPGLIDEHDAQPSDGEVANFLTLEAYFTFIGGGTDQVQRNIISEQLLGLPKEHDPSKSIPFSEVPS